MPKQLGAIHRKILDLLQQNPGGLTIYEIRDMLPGIEVQQHLDKRVRELRGDFEIPWDAKTRRYRLVGPRSAPHADDGTISAKLRAQIIHRANKRCQMCGLTVEDGAKLQIDHKIPRNWGGKTEEENLWAICQLCNGGKRDYFSSFNDDTMTAILIKESVFERLAETLLLHAGTPTPSWLLEFVANTDDYQADWQKRLRELRYPGIDWEIDVVRKRNQSGRVETSYILQSHKPLPANHKALIAEGNRRKRD